jgi:hypothetical protein
MARGVSVRRFTVLAVAIGVPIGLLVNFTVTSDELIVGFVSGGAGVILAWWIARPRLRSDDVDDRPDG